MMVVIVVINDGFRRDGLLNSLSLLCSDASRGNARAKESRAQSDDATASNDITNQNSM